MEYNDLDFILEHMDKAERELVPKKYRDFVK